MTRKKRKKYIFSDEEKQIIKQMKDELSMMGVPREEWSTHIQEALNFRKKMKNFPKEPKEKTGLSKFFDTVKEKVINLFQKLLPKRFRMFDGDLGDMMEDLYGEMSPEDMEMMDEFLMGGQGQIAPDINQIGKHGTFINERSDKKRMIVEFDDDLDEE